jgi:hypothetical protein
MRSLSHTMSPSVGQYGSRGPTVGFSRGYIGVKSIRVSLINPLWFTSTNAFRGTTILVSGELCRHCNRLVSSKRERYTAPEDVPSH